MIWRVAFLLMIPFSTFSQKIENVLKNEFYLLVNKQSNPQDFIQELGKSNLPIVSSKIAFPQIEDDFLQRVIRVKFDSTYTFHQQETLLREISGIEFWEPVPLMLHLSVPNDLGPANGDGSQWNLHITSAPAAWTITQGKPDIFVAIVDDGVLISHEDLENNVQINHLEIPNNGIDDDGNGYIDDYFGFDVSTDSPEVFDIELGHGTFTVGFSSATTNNGVGIASMGYQTRYLAVKSSNQRQIITHAYEGVVYAARRKSPIINMSWGGSRYSRIGEEVIRYAYDEGCILIAAAGNSGQVGNPLIYPAAYELTIAVAASDSLDRKAGFSSYGSFVNITAPGERVLSTTIENGYQVSSGTSFAAPLVAGVVGLMLAIDSSLTQSQILSCLSKTADNFYEKNPDFVGQLGAGRVNAHKACECASEINSQKPSAQIIANKTIVCKNETVDLLAQNFGGSAFTAHWILPGADVELVNGFTATPQYQNEGIYSVTLILQGFQGADTLSIPDFIVVQSGAEFESHKFNLVGVQNLENAGFTTNSERWQVLKLPSFNQTDSFSLAFINFEESEGTFSLSTPEFSLENLNQPNLTFNYAYAFNPEKNPDTLKIYATTLGNNPFDYFLMSIPGSDANVSGLARWHRQGEAYFPKPSEWCYDCFEIPLNGLAGLENIKIKFEVVSSGTQNIFIDDIRIVSLCEAPQILAPVNDFEVRLPEFATTFCQSQTVKFLHNDPNSTSIEWEFEGGIPQFSRERNPNVVYPEKGTYSVKLKVKNHLFEAEKIYDEFVKVEPKPNVFIRANAGGICKGDSIVFQGFGAVVYDWGILKDDSLGQLVLNPSGDVYVAVIGRDTLGCTAFADIFIPYFDVVNPTPEIFFEDNWIRSNPSFYERYQWLYNSTNIGENLPQHFPTNDGIYRLKVWNEFECVQLSNELEIIRSPDKNFSVYPNPAKDFLIAYSLVGFNFGEIRILDLSGNIIRIIQTENQNFVQIDVQTLPSGVYLINFSDGNSLKFVKE